MVWVKSSLQEEALEDGFRADVVFCGDSHKDCMDKLRDWLRLNKDWVDGDG